MAHRVAPEAEGDLDNIWYYVAKESGSIDIADRLIDSICQRFYLLACHPRVDEDLRTGLRSFSRGRVRHHLPHRGRRRGDSSRAARKPEYRNVVRPLKLI